MKAVILAAGSGKRLASLPWDKPKCLLPIGERTLFEHIACALLAYGVDTATIVLGYKSELIEEAMAKFPIKWTVVINDEYADTNTINSLYLARESLNEDFLYFNADVLFDSKILGPLIDAPQTALAIDAKTCADEEVKVIVDSGGRITRIGKSLDPGDCLGEFIGVAKFAAEACPSLIESLRRYNEDLQQKNLFFEAAVDAILGSVPCMVSDIGQLGAVEIDSPEDYQIACKLWASGTMTNTPSQE